MTDLRCRHNHTLIEGCSQCLSDSDWRPANEADSTRLQRAAQLAESRGCNPDLYCWGEHYDDALEEVQA